MSPGARFCHRCGRSAAASAPAGGGGPGTHRVPWIVATVVVVALVAAIGLRATGGFSFVTPDMANAGNQGAAAPGQGQRPAPDISRMSPRERFDRLFDRIMEAGARGDSAMVVQFTPMALGAYQQLDRFDNSARYRVAMVRLQVGEFDGAMALADTIMSLVPHHLLGLVIRGTAASFQGDSAGLSQAYHDFLDHYDAELQAGRPEYDTEKPMIDSFRRAALAGTGPTDQP